MIRLFIAGKEVELSNTTEIAITRQAATAINLDKRQLDFSNRVNIPATVPNIALMQFLGINGNTSERPYKYANARLEVDGITYADNLVAIVDQIGDEGYELRLLGNPFDAFSLMKKARMNEIDLPFYTHTLDALEYKDSQDNDAAYLYPAIELAYPENNRGRIFIDTSYPALFTRDVFNRLLEKYFTSYSGEWMETDLWYSDLFFAANINAKSWQDWETVIIRQNVDFRAENGDTFANPYWFAATLEKNESGKANTVLILSPALTRVSYNGARILTVKVKGKLFALGGSISLKALVKPFLQGTPLPSDTVVATSEICAAGLPDTAFVDVDGQFDLEVPENHDLYFAFNWSIAASGSVPFVSAEDFEITITPKNNSLYLDDFTPQRYMPDLSEWEFFIEVVKKYGLVFVVSNSGIRLETFKDVFTGKFGAVDWSNKLVNISDTQYSFGTYGKINYFQYAGDREPKQTTEYNGWDSVNFDNDRNEEEKDLLSMKGIAVTQTADRLLIFSEYITSNTGRVFLEGLPSILFARNDYQTTIFRGELPIWKLSATAGSLGEELDSSSGQSVARMDIWSDRINDFYGNLIDSLERPVVIEIEVYLTEIDFYNLDFFKLIYLEQFQKYYYLISVKDYIPGKVVKATLLEVKGGLSVTKTCIYSVEGLFQSECFAFEFPSDLDFINASPYFGFSALQLRERSSPLTSIFSVNNFTIGNFPTLSALLNAFELTFNDGGGRYSYTRDGNRFDVCYNSTERGLALEFFGNHNKGDAPFTLISDFITDEIIVTGQVLEVEFQVGEALTFQVNINGVWVTQTLTDGAWTSEPTTDTITTWRRINSEDVVIDSGVLTSVCNF